MSAEGCRSRRMPDGGCRRPHTGRRQARLRDARKIRDEGLNRSQALDHVSWLADVYGPRLQGSPAMRQAAEWVDEEADRVGPRQRPSGEVAVRQRLGAGSLQREHDRAAGPAAHRRAPLVDARHERRRHRRRRSRRHSLRRRLRKISRQARRQDRAHAAGARSADARRHRGPALERRAPQGSDDDADSGCRGGRRRRARRRRAPSLADRIQQFFVDERVVAAFDRGGDASIVAGDNQMSWRTQRTDGGTIFPSGGGGRDATPARSCRRSRSPSSTTTG